MKVITTYAGMLIPSFLVVSLAWYKTVRGRLYVCTDPIPVLEYFGAHVHTNKETYYAPIDEHYLTPKDHYLAPKRVVDTLWWFSFGATFLLAGAAMYLLRGMSNIK
jgi:hypothetical protein